MNSLMQAVWKCLRRHQPIPVPLQKGKRFQNRRELQLIEADIPSHPGEGVPVVSGAAPLPPSPPADETKRLTGTDIAVFRMARRGLRLFPVQAHGKHPLVGEWPRKATYDVGILSDWPHQFPGCNWGLACGAASAVFVLDVDGEAGAAAIRELSDRYGDKWTATLTVKTARGRRQKGRSPTNRL